MVDPRRRIPGPAASPEQSSKDIVLGRGDHPGYLMQQGNGQQAVQAVAPPSQPKPLPKTTKAVAAVMSQIGTIRKGGHNDFHNYDYARMEDLLHQLTPLMGQQGIMVTQTLANYQMVEQNRVIAEYDFYVYVDDEVSLPTRQPGMCMARDRKGNIDDKALLKCHTQA